ncbi:MAG: type II toxin-antitoxin system HicA family toxin [Chloroflexi bacterium]|nr:type II toxin-antitoxin system HicA family toxin [Chloroflexota bacterium]
MNLPDATLGRLGYQVAWQTGSHVRLTRTAEGEHRVTIPRHRTLKVGTLNSILKDVAKHLKMSKEELVRELWGGGC